ncbi:MAG: HAD hydrolase family protein, partial [Lachnospiraceae bacterium]|nr:HAD hydrolase family protein [Lachnospiraceae bacterium]
MIKMLLTDLDHTLLRQDGSVSDRTIQAISECRASGIKFAIA